MNLPYYLCVYRVPVYTRPSGLEPGLARPSLHLIWILIQIKSQVLYMYFFTTLSMPHTQFPEQQEADECAPIA